MIKTSFVDFSYNIFDKHHVYSLYSYLSAKGIRVDYINENTFRKTIDCIKELKPDVLLYSAFSIDSNIYFKFDRIIKEQFKVKSIMGGAGPTFDWSLSNCGTIDAFCVGEGEYALEEYLRNGFSGGKNIILHGEKSPKEFHNFVDLDSIPIPDRTIVYEKDTVLRSMPSKQFLAGRGCPYNCTYCYNNIFNRVFKGCGPVVRLKGVDYLIEEIRHTYKKYPFEVVVFHDDIFISNRKWFFEFAERFPRELGLQYSCCIRANLVNEDVVKALKESGCISANWSIECGNDYIRNKVLKRNMSREQILEAGHLLNRYNIPQKIGNMVGLPGEKFDDMFETLELNIAVKPQLGQGLIFVPFPSLELTEYALENNYLSKEVLENLPINYFTQSVLNFTPYEKTKIQKLAWLFQVLVDFPYLYRNKIIFNTLFRFPRWMLRFLFQLHYLYKFSRQYKVKTPFHISWLIMIRHLKDTLGLHRPDKKI